MSTVRDRACSTGASPNSGDLHLDHVTVVGEYDRHERGLGYDVLHSVGVCNVMVASLHGHDVLSM